MIVLFFAITALGAQDPEECRRELARAARGSIQWTRDLVLAKIRMVASSKRPKIPMNSTSFGKQNSKAIREITGFSGAYLMELAKVHVAKDWDGILRALDLDVLETRKAIKLTPEQFAKAVVALHDSGVEVHAGALQDDQSDRSRQVTKQAIGSGITGAQVYWAGFSRYGRDWTKALHAAELDPELIERRHQWPPAQLIEIVKTLAKKNVDINVLALYQDKFGEELFRHMGIKAKGCSVYRAARARFGSWDNLLRAADLDPAKIRRHFWRRGNLSLVPYQRELSTDATGTTRVVRVIGTRTEMPDEIAETNELVRRLDAFMTTVDPRERDLAMQVVDLVLATNKGTDVTKIASELGETDPTRVKNILTKFATSGILSESD